MRDEDIMSITYDHSDMRKTHDRRQTGRQQGIDPVGLLLRWQARIRQRRDLEEIDPRLLKDIGLTAEQRAEEVRKPFWKA